MISNLNKRFNVWEKEKIIIIKKLIDKDEDSKYWEKSKNKESMPQFSNFYMNEGINQLNHLHQSYIYFHYVCLEKT